MTVTVESIHWIPCSDQFPDDDQTVLIFNPLGGGEEVFLGWRSAGCWYDNYEGGIAVRATVTHWAQLPEGPK